MSAPAPAVLVPGWLHDHTRERLAGRFRLIETDDTLILASLDPAGRDAVRAIAGKAHIDADLIDNLPNLEIIANYGVGYDNVDAEHARRRGVVVTNTPDVLTEEVADTTIGLLINTVRELARAENYVRAGHWRTAAYPLSRLTLRTRHVGIYGMGRIGLAVARRLTAFGLRVSYHSRRPVPDIPYAYHETLAGLAAAVDTLVSLVPGGTPTAGSVNAHILRALGPDGVFINMGRGSVVDEDALAAALRDGTIAAAGLDVFATEPDISPALLALDNLTMLPHIGSASVHTRTAMADLVAENLIAWFAGGRALTPVP